MRANPFGPSDYEKLNPTDEDESEALAGLPFPSNSPLPAADGETRELVSVPPWMAKLEKATEARRSKLKGRDPVKEAEAQAERVRNAVAKRAAGEAAARNKKTREARDNPLRNALRSLRNAQCRQGAALRLLVERDELTAQMRKVLEERGIALWKTQREVIAAFNRAESLGATKDDLKWIVSTSIGQSSRPPFCDRCGFPTMQDGALGLGKCARCGYTPGK